VGKVTSKLQVTIPKRIADRYGIRPGDDLDWVEAGDTVRVIPDQRRNELPDPSRRLELFDAATARQAAREHERTAEPASDRGWSREELYQRGRAG
jgi:AbrB family looped-hinge helix DNA binding protein